MKLSESRPNLFAENKIFEQGGNHANRTLENSSISLKEEQVNFIYESLNNPKRLSLIFKASEHDYRAYFFHYFCDNTAHTFTLIKTEFGNVIAGYTPLAWNSSSYYSHDVDGLSFLLSLDMMKKMEIVDKTKAILCSTGDGPIFGQGYDICIRDQCNLLNEANPSYANFPESYNHSSKYKPKVPKTWKEFCGASKGCSFRVLEYEVYRV